MKGKPWFPLFGADWIRATRMLTPVVRTIYFELLLEMYDKGAPVPENHEVLGRLIGVPQSRLKQAVDQLVTLGKIRRVEGGLWNDRAEVELQGQKATSQLRKNAAEKRWRRTAASHDASARQESASHVRDCEEGIKVNENPEQNQSGGDANGYAGHMQNVCMSQSQYKRIESHSKVRSGKDAEPSRIGWEKLEAELRRAAGWIADPSPNLFVVGPIAELMRSGADLELDVLPVIRSKAPSLGGRHNWNYFVPAIREAWQSRIDVNSKPDRQHNGKRHSIRDSIEQAERYIETRGSKDGCSPDTLLLPGLQQSAARVRR